MSTPVNGPGDVAVGDLVEVSASWKGNDRTGVATVVKATDAKMTVRWPDGTTSCRMYTRVEVSTDFRRTRSTVRNFDRLTAHERWGRIGPKCDAAVSGYDNAPKTAFSHDAIRDRPDDVIAQVRALSAWLKDEPSKDAS